MRRRRILALVKLPNGTIGWFDVIVASRHPFLIMIRSAHMRQAWRLATIGLTTATGVALSPLSAAAPVVNVPPPEAPILARIVKEYQDNGGDVAACIVPEIRLMQLQAQYPTSAALQAVLAPLQQNKANPSEAGWCYSRTAPAPSAEEVTARTNITQSVQAIATQQARGGNAPACYNAFNTLARLQTGKDAAIYGGQAKLALALLRSSSGNGGGKANTAEGMCGVPKTVLPPPAVLNQPTQGFGKPAHRPPIASPAPMP
jgi:nitroreductase